MTARESYRRKFAGPSEHALTDDEFARSGRQFIRTDVTGNQIIAQLQSEVVRGDCIAFYINVGVLLGMALLH